MTKEARQGSSKAESRSSPDVFSVATPAINLPKGGGAIRGVGEKFAANPVTGTGSMSVPIATSPGRSGFAPQLSLSYDSGSGNGPFGFGWSLSIPAIIRKTDKGLPLYRDAEESDVFILSGAEDLVPILSQNALSQWVPEVLPQRKVDNKTYRIVRYRPRIEGLFARIERWANQSDPTDIFWRSISKDNITTWYGRTANSRIADPSDLSRIFSWLICESYDDKGNVIEYGYKEENSEDLAIAQANERNRTRSANRYLKWIRYGNHKPYLPQLLETEPWPTPPGATSADGSTDWYFEVVFDYGEHHSEVLLPTDAGIWTRRKDPFSSYRSGFEVRTYRLCQRVLMFHHFDGEGGVGKDCLVRSTDFKYSYEKSSDNVHDPVYSFLLSVTQTGYKRSNGKYVSKSLPPVEFEYTQPIVQDAVEEVADTSLENLPIGVDGSIYQWTDLHGEGIPGILTEQAGAWFYKRNLSPISSEKSVEFAPLELVAVKPNLSLAGGAQFMDLAGDGLPDLVVMDGPMPGFYEHDEKEDWQPFRPFTSRPNRNMHDPNLKFIDLDGDGHADVLITEDDAFVWHRSLAEEGFGPARRVVQSLDEENGPRLIFADVTQSIYLADLSGDGLTDLARIRNGEACYWPNLGYGRFGAKVTMDYSPWFDHSDQFDPKRIRLADIDGSGTTDIIYLHRDGVRLYFNQSGNSWSKPQVLRVFPRVDDIVSIVPTDLLGNGTACLVWSSPLPGDARRQMRYVDLMGGQKPHLLVKTINNLGTETRVQYAPSTRFYLQDKYDGKPWITRLPFPVHVVDRVETYDHISRNHFVTRYAYHHGYFDGEEREFRGFGMVEQWDSEQLAALSNSDAFPVGDNITAESHVPPVHTKTWFHTGIYLNRDHVSDFFAGLLNATDQGEYFREPGLTVAEARELLLPDTILPTDLTLVEEREACRSLKGSMLRQEVYALDGNDKERFPYTVTEQNFTIGVLQPQAGNRHAVFFTHARETLNFHYERNPTDPRIQHSLTLEVDQYGNVRKSVAVGYGRRMDAPDAALLPEDREKQRLIHITCTENEFTNAIPDEVDVYRTPLPAQSSTYELRKPQQEKSANGLTMLYRFEDLLGHVNQLGDGAHDVKYEDLEFTSATQAVVTDASEAGRYFRRLIEQVRTRYRPNDLGAAQNDPLILLPLGTAQAMALPGESWKLAFTPGLLDQIYVRSGQKLLPENPADVLEGDGEDRGGYVDLDGDGLWWIPSGRSFFSIDPTDSAEAELAEARQHFFLPRRYRDPFGHDAIVSFDSYDLLMFETRDALGNRVTVEENDYRVLQPRLISDPNRNQTAVKFDTLGMVAGTAVMGKPPPAVTEGDSLEDFIADLSQTQIDEFFDKPREADQAGKRSVPSQITHELLGSATTRIVYDLERFISHGEPVFAATLARETHVSHLATGEQTEIQISFSYSDGFGREVQKKIQAEPGPLVKGGPIVNPRSVGSGWTIFNNKGKPVRQYEPFFSATHRFEFGVMVGVSPVLFYDPTERVIATLHPNHTFEKIVFDPWQQTTYDVNDTCAPRNDQTGDPRTDTDIQGYVAEYFKTQPTDWETWHQQRQEGSLGPAEKAAADKAATHADTPTIAHFDALGRPFLIMAHNRLSRNGSLIDETYSTRIELDIEGNQREVIDALGRIVMRYDYSIAGPAENEETPTNRIHQSSMEAGERWTLNNVAGKPIRAWDSRDYARTLVYDKLQRLVRLIVDGNGLSQVLAEKTIYGEDQEEGPPNPEQTNHRGKIYRVYDGAGIVINEVYDFKWNLLRTSRQLLQNYRQQIDWNLEQALEGDPFTTTTHYDVLNREVSITMPDRSEIRHAFNEANLLDKVDVNLCGKHENGVPKWTTFVANIDYDAKGQREQIEYGCGAGDDLKGVKTKYTYDVKTFRLINLKTTRPHGGNGLTSQIFANEKVLQDLRYTYDPAGNITRIEDAALKTIYNKGAIKTVCEYTYDAIYRLIEAKGREHIGQSGFQFNPPDANRRDYPFVGAAHPNDLQALRNYTERYEYDAVGNFEFMRHVASGGSWTREYAYEADSLVESGRKSNRLTKTKLGNYGHTETYSYTDDRDNDVHGCMTSINDMRLNWDFEDQLQQADLGGGGTAYYVYDAAGQRVRKVIHSQNGSRQKERIYLGGFEIYREYNGNGSPKSERETLHVLDDQQRIALVETQTLKEGKKVVEPDSVHRYQLGNHLGSASVELSQDGALISYEEYHPYGTTAYQVHDAEVSLKRYRFTGKERDDETGLNYHRARYYAAWLGRWTSCDPQDLIDGVNSYRALRANPVIHVDESGTQPRARPEYIEMPEHEVRADDPKLRPRTGESYPDYLVRYKRETGATSPYSEGEFERLRPPSALETQDPNPSPRITGMSEDERESRRRAESENQRRGRAASHSLEAGLAAPLMAAGVAVIGTSVFALTIGRTATARASKIFFDPQRGGTEAAIAMLAAAVRGDKPVDVLTTGVSTFVAGSLRLKLTGPLAGNAAMANAIRSTVAGTSSLALIEGSRGRMRSASDYALLAVIGGVVNYRFNLIKPDVLRQGLLRNAWRAYGATANKDLAKHVLRYEDLFQGATLQIIKAFISPAGRSLGLWSGAPQGMQKR